MLRTFIPISGSKKNGCDWDPLDFPAATIFEVIFGSQTHPYSFANDENRFVRAFEELRDNGFIEILDAWSAEAQKGIAHTRENMPLREGEIVIIPVLTLLSSTRRGSEREGRYSVPEESVSVFQGSGQDERLDRFQ